MCKREVKWILKKSQYPAGIILIKWVSYTATVTTHLYSKPPLLGNYLHPLTQDLLITSQTPTH